MTRDEAIQYIESQGGSLRFTYATGTRIYRLPTLGVACDVLRELRAKGFPCKRSSQELFIKP